MVSLLLFCDGSDKHVLYGSQSPVLSGRNSPIAQKLDAEAGEYQIKNDAKKEKKEVGVYELFCFLSTFLEEEDSSSCWSEKCHSPEWKKLYYHVQFEFVINSGILSSLVSVIVVTFVWHIVLISVFSVKQWTLIWMLWFWFMLPSA